MRIKIFTFCLLISYTVNAQEIDPRKFSSKTITLADIADDIQYLPIDNSITIGSILSYKILQKSIYICSREMGVIKYDRTGDLENIQLAGRSQLMRKPEWSMS